MTGADITVWGVGTMRTMRVHWLLHELGVTEYRTRPIGSRTGETQTEDYGRLSPKRKIPVLEHGLFVLTESAAILNYLTEIFEAPAGFYRPADAADRARLNEWCFFVMTELDAHSLYVVRRHGDLADIYGAAPVAVDSAKEYFSLLLNAGTSRMDDDDDYVMGKDLSVADILLATCLEWAHAIKVPLSARMQRYRATVRQRPAYRHVYALNYPDRPPIAPAG